MSVLTPSLTHLFGSDAPPLNHSQGDNWRALRFFNLYRFTLAALFILLYEVGEGLPPPPLGMFLPQLFYYTSIAYLAASLLAMVALARRHPRFNWQRNVHVLIDILFISILMHASGGVASGVGMLLVISIAYASMISTGRGPLLFAAIASLTVLSEHTYALLTLSDARTSYPQAGLLGITLFATAIGAHVLARRARESEALAAQRGLDLANMAQLTEYTIQQMRTGVIVVDAQGMVRLINSAAWQMLGAPVIPGDAPLAHYSHELEQALLIWQHGQREGRTTLTPSGSPYRLLPQFVTIGGDQHLGNLIFLEDVNAATTQAQQLKLASLGRLTASIAHEIRNPLGAISHATELLHEAPGLESADQRLLVIIKKHSERINRIIEDVLMLGRREHSHGEQFILAPWLANFVEEFLQAEGEQTEVIFCHCEGALPINFDPNHLRQILTNLCHNGLRHASESPAPRVELYCGEIDEEWGFLDIVDHGPGISAEQLTQIFEPFYTTQGKGTGLGLYIARELADGNHAYLLYEPDEEGHSRFRLHFRKQRQDIE